MQLKFRTLQWSYRNNYIIMSKRKSTTSGTGSNITKFLKSPKFEGDTSTSKSTAICSFDQFMDIIDSDRIKVSLNCKVFK